MNDVDKLLAKAQVALAFLFSIGFIGILAALMFLARELTPTATTILTGLLSVFGTILTLVMNFFFARQRQPALPDPTTTTTSTTTTTTPTGVSPDVAPITSTVTVGPVTASTSNA